MARTQEVICKVEGGARLGDVRSLSFGLVSLSVYKIILPHRAVLVLVVFSSIWNRCASQSSFRELVESNQCQECPKNRIV